MVLFNNVIDYLEALDSLKLPTFFKVDILSEDEDTALTIKSIPSSPSSRFLDGKRDDNILFQIIVKHNDQLEALQLINDITNSLENAKIKLNDDTKTVLYVYSLPVFVEETSRGNFIYSVVFRAILI